MTRYFFGLVSITDMASAFFSPVGVPNLGNTILLELSFGFTSQENGRGSDLLLGDFGRVGWMRTLRAAIGGLQGTLVLPFFKYLGGRVFWQYT